METGVCRYFGFYIEMEGGTRKETSSTGISLRSYMGQTIIQESRYKVSLTRDMGLRS